MTSNADPSPAFRSSSRSASDGDIPCPTDISKGRRDVANEQAQFSEEADDFAFFASSFS
jgi:hypothetical protein